MDTEINIYDQMIDSIETKKRLLSEEYLSQIERIAAAIVQCYRIGGKVLICGNGGSASDAQHMEGELVGRFKQERKGLAAIALSANSTTVTALGNDYGFEWIYSKQVEAYGNQGDLLIGITTSGNSENINRAVIQAKQQGMTTVALLGKDGGMVKDSADITLIVPSDDTARIQEAHIMIIHIICGLVENQLFT